MITDRSWKLTKDNVKLAEEQLASLELKPDLIIVQAHDNKTFFVSKEDGSLCVPAKGPDGKFHMDGDLRVAIKDKTITLLKILKPILVAEPDVEKLLILPLPRYIFQERRCCSNPTHCTNLGSHTASEVKNGLAAL
jgi:hypothetical protein